MSSWKGKTRGGLLGYKIFIFILQKSGLGSAYFLLRIVAAYFVLFAPKASLSIFRYFRFVHQYRFWKAVVSVYKNFHVFGQTLLDKVALIAGFENKFTYTFEGEENLRKAKQEGKGLMLISAHLGNWDIAGHLLKRLDSKINVVMFEAEHEKIKAYMDELMKERTVTVIPIKNDLSHIFLINKALRNNEIICFHGDRFVQGSPAIKKKFFGREAFFPEGPFVIAAKLKIPFTFVYAFKETKRHYHLYATPINTLDNAHKILEDYIYSLEEKVMKYPEQWFNYYDFWSNNLSGADINNASHG